MTELSASDIVAVNVRQARQRRNWSMSELATRAHLSANIIQNIEGGRRGDDGRRRRDVTVDELLALAGALEMSVADLLPAATLMPHHSERERAIKAATETIDQEMVKVAAMEEIAKDLEKQSVRVHAEMYHLSKRIDESRQEIVAQKRIIALFKAPGD